MFNLSNTFIVNAIIIYSLISNAAYAEIPNLGGLRTDQVISISAIVNTDEDATFPGVWRGSTEVAKATCQMEYVFQQNHKYSSTWICGSYRAWQTGNWKIMKQGVMRFEIVDYEPKSYAGRKIYMPDSDTMDYRFVNNNQIHLESKIEGVSDAELYRAR